jgi:hypothetical protein
VTAIYPGESQEGELIVSDYTIEVIDLTDTARLRVEYDTDQNNPRTEWDMATGFVKIEGRGDWRLSDVPAVHDDPTRSGIAWAHDQLVPGFGRRSTDRFSEETVERWARIFHDLHIEYDSEHGGYWFVDPTWLEQNSPETGGGMTALDDQAKIIESERETYRQWAEGEVYGVILERRQSFIKQRVTRTDEGFEVDPEDPELFDEWEQIDAIWGCYLDDTYTAQVVADEHFELTEEERDALGLKVTERRETPAEAAAGVSGEW